MNIEAKQLQEKLASQRSNAIFSLVKMLMAINNLIIEIFFLAFISFFFLLIRRSDISELFLSHYRQR